ncbi:MAG: CHAT domain-containing protein, partial [Acidobacteria bacterium]|nr:CHAT domain-containing protein [Acidobacteriota bacterium]
HGVLNSANPMYSWLSLGGEAKDPAGGSLEAREILGMDLNADLAVLSACDTARGEFFPGEGLVGMSWAFLAAGTRTAVVSQWGVDSAGTTELMLAFHRNLRASPQARRTHSRASSLQQAVLQLMKTPQYRHPYYWAGFVMIGNGY